MPKAMASMPEQLWKTKLEEELAPCRGPATVAQLRPRGLLGDRRTVRGAGSDQPLQSLSPWHRACKHAGISASSQGAQPRERGGQNPGKTLEADQSKGKKKNQICIG